MGAVQAADGGGSSKKTPTPAPTPTNKPSSKPTNQPTPAPTAKPPASKGQLSPEEEYRQIQAEKALGRNRTRPEEKEDGRNRTGPRPRNPDTGGRTPAKGDRTPVAPEVKTGARKTEATVDSYREKRAAFVKTLEKNGDIATWIKKHSKEYLASKGDPKKFNEFLKKCNDFIDNKWGEPGDELRTRMKVQLGGLGVEFENLFRAAASGKTDSDSKGIPGLSNDTLKKLGLERPDQLQKFLKELGAKDDGLKDKGIQDLAGDLFKQLGLKAGDPGAETIRNMFLQAAFKVDGQSAETRLTRQKLYDLIKAQDAFNALPHKVPPGLTGTALRAAGEWLAKNHINLEAAQKDYAAAQGELSRKATELNSAVANEIGAAAAKKMLDAYTRARDDAAKLPPAARALVESDLNNRIKLALQSLGDAKKGENTFTDFTPDVLAKALADVKSAHGPELNDIIDSHGDKFGARTRLETHLDRIEALGSKGAVDPVTTALAREAGVDLNVDDKTLTEPERALRKSDMPAFIRARMLNVDLNPKNDTNTANDYLASAVNPADALKYAYDKLQQAEAGSSPESKRDFIALLGASSDLRSDYIKDEVLPLLTGSNPDPGAALDLFKNIQDGALSPEEKQELWDVIAGAPQFTPEAVRAVIDKAAVVPPATTTQEKMLAQYDTTIPADRLPAKLGKDPDQLPPQYAQLLLDAIKSRSSLGWYQTSDEAIAARMTSQGPRHGETFLKYLNDLASAAGPDAVRDLASWLTRPSSPQASLLNDLAKNNELRGLFGSTDNPNALELPTILADQLVGKSDPAGIGSLLEEALPIRTRYLNDLANKELAKSQSKAFERKPDEIATEWTRRTADDPDYFTTRTLPPAGDARSDLIGNALGYPKRQLGYTPGEKKTITQAVKYITDVGGPNASFKLLPMLYFDKEGGGVRKVTLAEVKDKNGETVIIDLSAAPSGEHGNWKYDSFQDFIDNNKLSTEGNFYIPKDGGRPYIQNDQILNGNADDNYIKIQAANTTPGEHVKRVGDIAAGVAALGASIFLAPETGLMSVPAGILAAATLWGIGSSLHSLQDMADHGQSLDFGNAEARAAWFGLLSSGFSGVSFGSLGAASLLGQRGAMLAGAAARASTTSPGIVAASLAARSNSLLSASARGTRAASVAGKLSTLPDVVSLAEGTFGLLPALYEGKLDWDSIHGSGYDVLLLGLGVGGLGLDAYASGKAAGLDGGSGRVTPTRRGSNTDDGGTFRPPSFIRLNPPDAALFRDGSAGIADPEIPASAKNADPQSRDFDDRAREGLRDEAENLERRTQELDTRIANTHGDEREALIRERDTLLAYSAFVRGNLDMLDVANGLPDAAPSATAGTVPSLAAPVRESDNFPAGVRMALEMFGRTPDDKIRYARQIEEEAERLRAGIREGTQPATLQGRVLSLERTRNLVLFEAARQLAGSNRESSPSQGLDELLGRVLAWNGPLREKDIYDLYSRSTSPESLTPEWDDITGENRAPIGYLRGISDLAKARPPGAETFSQFGPAGLEKTRSRPISELFPGLLDGRPSSAYPLERAANDFFHFERTGSATDVTDRIYVHARADYALDVMKFLVKDVIDRPDLFPGIESGKISGPKAAGERRDNIVLYVDSATRPKVLDTLRRYQQVHPEHFADEIPLMTRAVMPGVSVGDDPPGRASFGETRSLAILQAFDRALGLTPRTDPSFPAVFRGKVREAFLEAKVHPDDPSRNLRRPAQDDPLRAVVPPGDVDPIYFDEAAYRLRSMPRPPQSDAPPITMSLGADGDPEAGGSTAAALIGHAEGLVREANDIDRRMEEMEGHERTRLQNKAAALRAEAASLRGRAALDDPDRIGSLPEHLTENPASVEDILSQLGARGAKAGALLEAYAKPHSGRGGIPPFAEAKFRATPPARPADLDKLPPDTKRPAVMTADKLVPRGAPSAGPEDVVYSGNAWPEILAAAARGTGTRAAPVHLYVIKVDSGRQRGVDFSPAHVQAYGVIPPDGTDIALYRSPTGSGLVNPPSLEQALGPAGFQSHYAVVLSRRPLRELAADKGLRAVPEDDPSQSRLGSLFNRSGPPAQMPAPATGSVPPVRITTPATVPAIPPEMHVNPVSQAWSAPAGALDGSGSRAYPVSQWPMYKARMERGEMDSWADRHVYLVQAGHGQDEISFGREHIQASGTIKSGTREVVWREEMKGGPNPRSMFRQFGRPRGADNAYYMIVSDRPPTEIKRAGAVSQVPVDHDGSTIPGPQGDAYAVPDHASLRKGARFGPRGIAAFGLPRGVSSGRAMWDQFRVKGEPPIRPEDEGWYVSTEVAQTIGRPLIPVQGTDYALASGPHKWSTPSRPQYAQIKAYQERISEADEKQGLVPGQKAHTILFLQPASYTTKAPYGTQKSASSLDVAEVSYRDGARDDERLATQWEELGKEKANIRALGSNRIIRSRLTLEARNEIDRLVSSLDDGPTSSRFPADRWPVEGIKELMTIREKLKSELRTPESKIAIRILEAAQEELKTVDFQRRSVPVLSGFEYYPTWPVPSSKNIQKLLENTDFTSKFNDPAALDQLEALKSALDSGTIRSQLSEGTLDAPLLETLRQTLIGSAPTGKGSKPLSKRIDRVAADIASIKDLIADIKNRDHVFPEEYEKKKLPGKYLDEFFLKHPEIRPAIQVDVSREYANLQGGRSYKFMDPLNPLQRGKEAVALDAEFDKKLEDLRKRGAVMFVHADHGRMEFATDRRAVAAPGDGRYFFPLMHALMKTGGYDLSGLKFAERDFVLTENDINQIVQKGRTRRHLDIVVENMGIGRWVEPSPDFLGMLAWAVQHPLLDHVKFSMGGPAVQALLTDPATRTRMVELTRTGRIIAGGDSNGFQNFEQAYADWNSPAHQLFLDELIRTDRTAFKHYASEGLLDAYGASRSREDWAQYLAWRNPANQEFISKLDESARADLEKRFTAYEATLPSNLRDTQGQPLAFADLDGKEPSSLIKPPGSLGAAAAPAVPANQEFQDASFVLLSGGQQKLDLGSLVEAGGFGASRSLVNNGVRLVPPAAASSQPPIQPYAPPMSRAELDALRYTFANEEHKFSNEALDAAHAAARTGAPLVLQLNTLLTTELVQKRQEALVDSVGASREVKKQIWSRIGAYSLVLGGAGAIVHYLATTGGFGGLTTPNLLVTGAGGAARGIGTPVIAFSTQLARKLQEAMTEQGILTEPMLEVLGRRLLIQGLKMNLGKERLEGTGGVRDVIGQAKVDTAYINATPIDGNANDSQDIRQAQVHAIAKQVDDQLERATGGGWTGIGRTHVRSPSGRNLARLSAAGYTAGAGLSAANIGRDPLQLGDLSWLSDGVFTSSAIAAGVGAGLQVIALASGMHGNNWSQGKFLRKLQNYYLSWTSAIGSSVATGMYLWAGLTVDHDRMRDVAFGAIIAGAQIKLAWQATTAERGKGVKVSRLRWLRGGAVAAAAIGATIFGIARALEDRANQRP